MCNTLRCSICNKVNNSEVISSPEEFIRGTRGVRKFYPDPDNPGGYLCYKCKTEIEETLSVFNEFEETITDDSDMA